MSKQYLNFEVESAEIIEENPNSQFLTAEVHAFSSGINRHEMECSEDVLRETASTIYEKPILYSINRIFNDFGSHVEPGNSLIAGFVVPDSARFDKLEDGRIGLKVLTKIWKRYAPKVVEFFKRDEGNKKVSVEMELYDSKKMSDGLTEMLKFAYTGICLLGDMITEASPGANIQVLSFAKEHQDYQKAYLQEFAKYDDLSFKIPQKVKENAKQGLELRKEYGRGGTSVGLATARYLVNNDTATPEKVRHIAKYFPRHAGDNLDDKTSNGWIAWQLWGGNSARSWSSKLVDQMNKLDEKQMAYFTGSNDLERKEDNFSMDEDEKKEVENKEEEKEEMAVNEEEQTPKEEEKMSAETEQKEDEKEESFSLDAYLDVPAALAFLEAETEKNAEIVSEMKREKMNYAKMFGMLYNNYKNMCDDVKMSKTEMEKMSADREVYMKEFEELKKFKADMEMKQKEQEVGMTMNEVMEYMPKDTQAEMREMSQNFSLENIDVWKNLVRAKAFEFSKDKKNDGVMKIGLPFANNGRDEKKNGSVWDRVG